MPFKSERLYEPQVGDRVRVTFEAIVSNTNRGCVCTSADEGGTPIVALTYLERLEGASVEKLEPPVETFKPGDVVRSKYTDYRFLIAKGGYVDLLNNIWEDGEHLLAQFTSKHYERVNLQEAPF